MKIFRITMRQNIPYVISRTMNEKNLHHKTKRWHMKKVKREEIREEEKREGRREGRREEEREEKREEKEKRNE